jgi:hypothetical protein
MKLMKMNILCDGAVLSFVDEEKFLPMHPDSDEDINEDMFKMKLLKKKLSSIIS